MLDISYRSLFWYPHDVTMSCFSMGVCDHQGVHTWPSCWIKSFKQSWRRRPDEMDRVVRYAFWKAWFFVMKLQCSSRWISFWWRYIDKQDTDTDSKQYIPITNSNKHLLCHGVSQVFLFLAFIILAHICVPKNRHPIPISIDSAHPQQLSEKS